MRKIFSEMFLYLFLFFILIIEGFGISWGRLISRYTILLFPVILFGIDISIKRKIFLPHYASIFFVFFSICVAVSTIFAVNIEAAFEHQLYYLAIFLLFIYIYNHKNELKTGVGYFVTVSTIVLLIYSFFLTFIIPDGWPFLLPIREFQFVYESLDDFSHHPIGAFIIIPLTIIFTYFWYKPKPLKSVILLILFSILLLSFLRSAYIAFGAVVAFYIFTVSSDKKQKLNLRKIFGFFIIAITLTSFVVVTNISTKFPLLGSVNTFITTHIESMKQKSLLNARDKFVEQSLNSISLKPLTGVGSYNFYYASMRHADADGYVTGSSHNLILDIFVENGIVGGFIFTLISTLLLYKGVLKFKEGSIQEKSFFAVIMALFILFQFGHYHKMYFLFIFFFFVAALLYEEKQTVEDKYSVTMISSVVVSMLSFVFISANILNASNYSQLAAKIYPLSIRIQRTAINENVSMKAYEAADAQLSNVYTFYYEDPFTLEFIGDYYKNRFEERKAIEYYLLALKYAPHELSYLKLIYEAYESVSGQERARVFVQNYIDSSKILYTNPYSEETNLFYEWCDSKGITCLR